MKTLGMLALCSFTIWAQAQNTSQIQGTVQDVTGSAVPGAEVRTTQTDTGTIRSTTAGLDGGYVLANLPIGPYRLEVSKQGFSTYVAAPGMEVRGMDGGGHHSGGDPGRLPGVPLYRDQVYGGAYQQLNRDRDAVPDQKSGRTDDKRATVPLEIAPKKRQPAGLQSAYDTSGLRETPSSGQKIDSPSMVWQADQGGGRKAAIRFECRYSFGSAFAL